MMAVQPGNPTMRRVRPVNHVHMLGIGGMAAPAEVLVGVGRPQSGIDLKNSTIPGGST